MDEFNNPQNPNQQIRLHLDSPISGEDFGVILHSNLAVNLVQNNDEPVNVAYFSPSAGIFTMAMLFFYKPYGLQSYSVDFDDRVGVVALADVVTSLTPPVFAMTSDFSPLLLPSLATFPAVTSLFASFQANGNYSVIVEHDSCEDEFHSYMLCSHLHSTKFRAYYAHYQKNDDGAFMLYNYGMINGNHSFESAPSARLFIESCLLANFGDFPNIGSVGFVSRFLLGYNHFIVRPQSGLSSIRKLCVPDRVSKTPPRSDAVLDPIRTSPLSYEEKKKKADLVIKYRREAKQRRDVFRPQGLFDAFRTHVVVDENLQDSIEGLSESAKAFSESLPDLKGLLNRLSERGLDLNLKTDSAYLHVPAIVTLLSLAYMSYTDGGKWKGALLAASATYAGLCLNQHKGWMLSKLARVINRHTDEVKPQGFDTGMIEDISGVIISYMAMLSAKTHVATSGKIAAFVKGFSNFDRAKNGLSDAIGFGLRTLEKITNWFRVEILGWPRISLVESSVPELKAWTDKVDILVDEAHRGVLYVNSANSARLHALKMEGNQLSAKKFSLSDSHQVRSALSTYLVTLRKLTVPFDNANFTGNGARMEPVVVLLHGEPGTGKTWSLLPLIMDTLKETLPPERSKALDDDLNNEIFTRVPETKFWEGYRGQNACIFDDFGQNRDCAGNPDNEYMELIRSANIFPYLLHMAGIEAKGCTNFTSRLIFCTTNVTHFTPQSIVEQKAVMRRFDIIVSVYPKPEYCIDPTADRADRKLDKNKAASVSGFNEDIYEFCLKKPDGCSIGTDILEILSFRELKDKIVALYKQREITADNYIESVYARNFVPPVKAQSGESHVEMEELKDFDEKFDRCSFDISNLSLEELLAEEAEDPILSGQELFRIMKERLEKPLVFRKAMGTLGYNSTLEDSIFSFIAYRRHPAAFLRCLDEKEESLPRLISRLAPRSGPEVVCPDVDVGGLAKARAVLNKYWNKLSDFVGSIKKSFSWLDEWQKAFLIGSGILLLYKAYRSYKGKVEDSVSAESGGPRDKNPKFVVKKLGTTVFKPEGGRDEDAHAKMVKAVMKSSYRLTVPSYGNLQIGYITFVKGKVAIMPYHFLSQLKSLVDEFLDPNSVIRIENASSGSGRDVKVQDFFDGFKENADLKKKDLCMCEFPNLHQHPDIVNYFVTTKQLNFKTIPVGLYGLRDSPAGVYSAHAPAVRENEQLVVCDEGDYTVTDVLKYSLPTEPGDCGCLVVAQNSGFGPGKFLGVHVAGSENRIGFSNIVTQECLVEGLKAFSALFPPPSTEEFFLPQCAEFPVKGHFVPLKISPKAISTPMRSSIAPSVLHNMWSVSPYGLPRLRPFEVDGVVKDPLLMAIERYGRDPVMVDCGSLRLASRYIVSVVMPVLLGAHNAPPRILSFDEAVLGLPEEKYCKSIPRGTSAGYPYVLRETPGCRGKERFFGKGQDFDLSGVECQQLRTECERSLADARNGIRSEVVYVDFLKDETRKHKRVREGNTRLISAAPVAYTILCRMYFLAFVMSAMSNNLFVGIGVGINCYSQDWHVLAKLLLSKGNNIIAGDFTGFDTSHYEFLANLVLAIIQEYYNGHEPLVREVLFADLTNSVHIVRNLIYMWTAGRLPSGHPLTAVFSTYMNYILYVACWIKLHPAGAAGVSDFHKHVYFVGYGDDSIVSVSDWAVKFFNYQTISECMASFGYTYTDEMKDGDGIGPPARGLSEVTFLKRSFRFEAFVGRFVAPLRLEAILESLYWTQRGYKSHDITCDKVDTALRELSLHSREVFDEWCPRILEASRERLNHFPKIVDYRVLQQISCGLEVFW